MALSMRDLEMFDVGFQLTPLVPNGIFTLTMPNGDYRTFRIHTVRPDATFAPGERILSILSGPENDASYMGFAFVYSGGFRVWGKMKGTKEPSQYERYAEVLWRLLISDTVAGYELATSKRCLRCNRLLTTPESLESGYGPECSKHMMHFTTFTI